MSNAKNIDDRLRKHPLLRERFETILDIAEGKDTGPDTADSVEEKAIEETRKLGQELMTEWANQKAEKEVQHYRRENPSAKVQKKRSPVGILPLAK